MPSDADALQGLWRVASGSAAGTHFQFDGDRVREIVPSIVDDGSVTTTFVLDPTASPKRITKTTVWAPRRNRRSLPPYVRRGIYELVRDTLRLRWAGGKEEWPAVFTNRDGTLITLARDHGPPPATKQPSGKQPIDDPVLGLIEWDDDSDWWEGVIPLPGGRTAELHLDLPGATDAEVIRRGRNFLAWVLTNERAARLFAGRFLLGQEFGQPEGEEPEDEAEFAARLALDSAGLRGDGTGSLYFDDGNLFWGHVVIVRLGADMRFKDASIAG